MYLCPLCGFAGGSSRVSPSDGQRRTARLRRGGRPGTPRRPLPRGRGAAGEGSSTRGAPWGAWGRWGLGWSPADRGAKPWHLLQAGQRARGVLPTPELASWAYVSKNGACGCAQGRAPACSVRASGCLVWMPAGLVLGCDLLVAETDTLLPPVVFWVAYDSFVLVILLKK